MTRINLLPPRGWSAGHRGDFLRVALGPPVRHGNRIFYWALVVCSTRPGVIGVARRLHSYEVSDADS